MTLLEEIRAMSREAAYQMERVDCCTDQDIRSLTQNDLQELLPGLSNFKIRKKIYEAIHKKRPIHAVLNELKNFIPDDLFRDAFSGNGALQDYLQMLKALKTEVNHVQEFLDAHIDLLEKFSQRDDTNPDKNQDLVPSLNLFATAPSNATNVYPLEHNRHPQKTQASHMMHNFGRDYTHQVSQPKVQAAVTYKVIVSGNTLNRHKDVLELLKSNGWDSLHLQEAQRDEDRQLTIVFCPIVSRVGTDVETALHDIPDDEPVILVMMHHSHSASVPPAVRHDLHHNIVLKVSVFFHETVPGILKCPQNKEAISQIQTKLRSFSAKTGKPFHHTFNQNSNMFGK